MAAISTPAPCSGSTVSCAVATAAYIGPLQHSITLVSRSRATNKPAWLLSFHLPRALHILIKLTCPGGILQGAWATMRSCGLTH